MGANMFVFLLFGVLYCATGQPYQRDWSADWDRVPNGVGGHVKYENGNFGFKGNGWVDKHKNWGVGASFNWRFRRSLQEWGLKKPLQLDEVFHVYIEADPCKFMVYDRNFDGQLTREEVASIFVDGSLGDKLFDDLDVIDKDGVVTKEEFEFMAPQLIVRCVPQGLYSIPKV